MQVTRDSCSCEMPRCVTTDFINVVATLLWDVCVFGAAWCLDGAQRRGYSACGLTRNGF